MIEPSAKRFSELLRWNSVNGTAEGGDQCLLNDFYSEWFYSGWDDAEAGKLPWIMNVGAAHHKSYRTLMRMQSRDEPAIVHFVGGESKPWLFMVLKFNGMADRIPEAVTGLLRAWDHMYWLGKTNRVCAGTLSKQERREALAVLEAA